MKEEQDQLKAKLSQYEDSLEVILETVQVVAQGLTSMQQLVTLLTLLTTQLYLMKDSGNSETTETIIDELNLCRSQTDPLLILTLSVIRPREVSVLETNVKYICRWLLQSLLQMIVKKLDELAVPGVLESASVSVESKCSILHPSRKTRRLLEFLDELHRVLCCSTLFSELISYVWEHAFVHMNSILLQNLLKRADLCTPTNALNAKLALGSLESWLRQYPAQDFHFQNFDKLL